MSKRIRERYQTQNYIGGDRRLEGLWSKDTPWDDDGYLIQYGYDEAETSFHILTTDGIRGRDILEHGVPRPTRGRVSRLAGSPPPRRAPWSTNTAGGLLRWLERAPDD